ncbi:uncharacterized protein HMPREF1541_05412 [Cyphellophora europaea CBS 101466]|uniref:Carboxypeptidase M14B n=1 Tax=Cyphellophora europaea (strain CBS 101466) TaxID=1220924 RepID=W2RTY9_CYPE1|nr:uncharacterized protein HMPREF1541_05412 [Cyphellophora europaea CBS 101466]ETN39189.1 hypothetical protein HMPREF1541_05412 [Cyphellophora europaea CBS 101466]
MRFSSSPVVLTLTAATIRAQLQYGENQRGMIKDSDIVAQAFPDVEGIELLSPAFIRPETTSPGWSDGTDGPTDDVEMDYFYRTLASRNEWLTYLAAEFTSEEGRAINYLYLSDQSVNSTKLKVYIQAAIHGDEPAGDQSVMALLGKMDANQTWAASILEKMDIKILPRYNVDGVAYFQRQLASNFDGNREHLKLARQQSRDIKKVFMDYSPHISVDMHEFRAPAVYGGDYQHGSDALISGGINPNIRQEIRDLLLDLFIPAMGDRLESHGLRWEPYVTGSSNSTPGSRIEFEEAVTEARTGRNAYGLTQTVSFLCEMRGIRLADQHFQRRVATALLKLETILETARDNFDNVLSTIEDARESFISSDDDIVVTDYFTPKNRTFTMVNRNTGEIEQVDIDYWVSTPSVANLTRPRPEAYLIPKTWSDVVAKLENYGLEVETLDYEYRGVVEALNITSSELDDSIYEGTVLNTVTTEPMYREVVLPAGSYLLSTRQKNAALAFIALEPENIDSFVTFNIIPMDVGDEYPVFRIME